MNKRFFLKPFINISFAMVLFAHCYSQAQISNEKSFQSAISEDAADLSYKQACASQRRSDATYTGSNLGNPTALDDGKYPNPIANYLKTFSAAEIKKLKEVMRSYIVSRSINQESIVTNAKLKSFLQLNFGEAGNDIYHAIDFHNFIPPLKYLGSKFTLMAPTQFIENNFDPDIVEVIIQYLQNKFTHGNIFDDLVESGIKYVHLSKQQATDAAMSILTTWGALGAAVSNSFVMLPPSSINDINPNYYSKLEYRRIVESVRNALIKLQEIAPYDVTQMNRFIYKLWKAFNTKVATYHFYNPEKDQNYMLPKNVLVPQCLIHKTYHFWMSAGLKYIAQKKCQANVAKKRICEKAIFSVGALYEYLYSWGDERTNRPMEILNIRGSNEVELTRLYLALKATGSVWSPDKNDAQNTMNVQKYFVTSFNQDADIATIEAYIKFLKETENIDMYIKGDYYYYHDSFLNLLRTVPYLNKRFGVEEMQNSAFHDFNQ